VTQTEYDDLSDGSLIEDEALKNAVELDSEMDDSIEMEDPIASMDAADVCFSLHQSLRMVKVVSP